MIKKASIVMVIIAMILTTPCAAQGDTSGPPDGWSENELQQLFYWVDDSWEKLEPTEYARNYNSNTYGIAIVYDPEKKGFTSVDEFIKQSEALTTEEKWLYELEDYEVLDWSNNSFDGKMLKKTVKLKSDFKESQAKTYSIEG